MRPAKIDRQLAAEMMRHGHSDSKIAERFGTSRQAVNLLRKSLAERGKLETGAEDQEGPVQDSSLAVRSGTFQERTPPVFPSDHDRTVEPTYDQITRWIVATINEAALVPELQRELEEIKQRSQEQQVEIDLLRAQLENARKDRASTMARAAEYQMAIEQLRNARQALPTDGPDPDDSPG